MKFKEITEGELKEMVRVFPAYQEASDSKKLGVLKTMQEWILVELSQLDIDQEK